MSIRGAKRVRPEDVGRDERVATPRGFSRTFHAKRRADHVIGLHTRCAVVLG